MVFIHLNIIVLLYFTMEALCVFCQVDLEFLILFTRISVLKVLKK
jgi:hypothetical protein